MTATAPAPPRCTRSVAQDEIAVAFSCAGERLLGVLHRARGRTGVIVVVGGPQYRAGSHRFFVTLARELAGAGHPVLRFDVRGMGDSSGAQRSFEHVTADIEAAIDSLIAHQPSVERVALFGLCDGASAALLYVHERPGDTRVGCLCLLNPWVRSEQSLAATQVRHYYARRVLDLGFWTKVMKGRVGIRAMRDLVGSIKLARRGDPLGPSRGQTFQHRMRSAWQRFDGPCLLALSENDYTAKEFEQAISNDAGWQGVLKEGRVMRRVISRADHTLSSSDGREQFTKLMVQWLSASENDSYSSDSIRGRALPGGVTPR